MKIKDSKEKILGCEIKVRETAETKSLQRFQERRTAKRKEDIFFDLGIENISKKHIPQKEIEFSNIIGGSIQWEQKKLTVKKCLEKS